MAPELRLDDLLQLIDQPFEVFNSRDIAITGIRGLADAGPTELTFAAHGRADLLRTCRAGAVITNEPVGSLRDLDRFHDVVWILTNEPRRAIAHVAAAFAVPLLGAGIDDSAHVDPTARIGSEVVLGAHVTVGPSAQVGDQAIVSHGAHLMRDVHVGHRASIGPGAVIGFNGFGYERTDDGWIHLPHLGSVLIGDGVEIGANVCVDRGTFGDTVIEAGVKIDNLSQIAHNVRIGANTIITAGCIVAGSVTIGRDVWVGPGSSILNGIRIGDGAFVGIGSTVIRDVAAAARVSGVPARPIPE